jgi:hypothetical protein
VRPALLVAQVDLDARRRGVEAHDLALVRRPARVAGAAEVQALDEVRLARPVAAVDHGQAGAQLDVRGRVAAEVAQAQAGDEHRAALRRSA